MTRQQFVTIPTMITFAKTFVEATDMLHPTVRKTKKSWKKWPMIMNNSSVANPHANICDFARHVSPSEHTFVRQFKHLSFAETLPCTRRW